VAMTAVEQAVFDAAMRVAAKFDGGTTISAASIEGRRLIKKCRAAATAEGKTLLQRAQETTDDQ